MTPFTDQTVISRRAAAKYHAQINQCRDDLLNFSKLHGDFVSLCFARIDASKAKLKRPPTGEIFPHLVAESLSLNDFDRRMLMAAWLALFGYICIVDHEFDKKGYLNGQTSIAAAALLGWGIATTGRYAAGTPYADVFLSNINRAFAGQYDDIMTRGDTGADRTLSDIDKNRAMIATVAGLCAAAGETDQRVIQAGEALLGPFQILDDLEDLQEDHGENNVTAFVRVLREGVSATMPLSRDAMYRTIIRDARTKNEIIRAADGLEKALLLLDPVRDLALVEYLAGWRDGAAALIRLLDNYQREPSQVKEPEIMRQIEQVANASS